MMSRPSTRGSSLVARGLGISSPTRVLAAALVGTVSVNASLAMQFGGTQTLVALSALFFASVATGAWAISRDVCSKSAQAISNLRSIGATRPFILSAVLVSILSYATLAAACGAFAGAVAGESVLGAGIALERAMVYAALLAAVSAAASGAGAYAGVRGAWRS